MQTKDIGLAALAVANNCTLMDYTVDELNQMWFTFEDTEEARKLEAEFHRATATVNVQSFLGATKMLKALIYENRRNIIYEHTRGTSNKTATR